MLRAQGGDAAALARLIRRNEGLVLRHALQLTNDPEAAADVAQETWLAVVRRLGSLGDPRAFHAYTLRIATNKAADWTRGRVRQRRAWTRLRNLAHEMASPADAGATGAAATDDARAVRATLDGLSPEHALVVSLHYAEGLSLGEIAVALGVPLGTVKSRLHHARERLRRALRERIEA